MSSQYPYASGDLLVERNAYSYSSFGGRSFLDAWEADRDGVCRTLPTPLALPAAQSFLSAPEGGGFVTAELLEFLASRIIERSSAITPDTSHWLDLLVQRFEVTKRLHRAYNARHRAVDRAEFRDLSLYVRFAEVLEAAYRVSGVLPYLNALLKCLDTLCALRAELDSKLGGRLARLIRKEREVVCSLRCRSESERVYGEWNHPYGGKVDPFSRIDDGQVLTSLRGVVFLAADTARSKAYAQALFRGGMHPEHVLFFGESRTSRCATTDPRQSKAVAGVYLPDLSQPLRATCQRAGWSFEEVAAEHVNDAAVVERLRALRPRLVIYSGYGGQIVSPEALATAGGFLHLHAGWLPEERGSTTIYYSLLREKRCAVSALLLAPEIDAGPIVARRRYPAPPAGTNIDHLYDGAIRADLLVRTLHHYALEGEFTELLPQEPGGGTMHYIIHPVIKHIALLRLQRFAPSTRPAA